MLDKRITLSWKQRFTTKTFLQDCQSTQSSWNILIKRSGKTPIIRNIMCNSPEEYFFQDTNFCKHIYLFPFPEIWCLDLGLRTWTWQLTKNVWLTETEPWTKHAEIICNNSHDVYIYLPPPHDEWPGSRDVWRLGRLSNLRASVAPRPQSRHHRSWG